MAKVVDSQAPNSMRGWVLADAGDIADLELKRVEIPEPQKGQIRVKIVASTSNPVDWKHSTFKGLSTFPAVFGCDGAGVVDAVGEGVEAFAKGDRVHYFGNVFAAHGTFAEFAIADAMAVVKIPEGMTFGQAAVTPCAAWTAYEALFDRMRVQPGQSVFIAAGAGGVGHFATQMAKNAGCRVITSASGSNVELLRKRGFEVIDYKEVKSVKDEVMRLTDGKGVDAAFDMLGEEQALETMQFVKFAGQYTHIAVGVPALPNGGAFFNALTIHHVFTPGNVVRPDDAARFCEIGKAADALIVAHKVLPDISKTVPFDAVKDVLLEQKAGHVRGKILISMSTPPEAVLDAAYVPQ